MRAATKKKTRKSDKNVGLIAAGVAAVAFVAVIGWFVLRGSPSVATAHNADPTAVPGSVADEEIPDITALESAGGLEVKLTDESDPERVAGVLTAERFEPVGVNERSVEQPRAWIYLKDGRFAYMRAPRGRFFMPTPNAAPESGMLQSAEGEPVRFMLFAPTPDGEQPDPEVVVPLLTAEFDEPVEFDMRHARASTVGRFRIFTPEIEFVGSNLTAMINQVRSRLELVEVRKGESITFTPLTDAERARIEATRGTPGPRKVSPTKPAPAGEPPVASASEDGNQKPGVATPRRGNRRARAQAAAPVEPTPTGPKTDYYRAVFMDGVRVTYGDRVLDADKLDLFLRLIDNQLPEDAIAKLQFARGDDTGANPAADVAAKPDRAARGAKSGGKTGASDPVLDVLAGSDSGDDAGADEASEPATTAVAAADAPMPLTLKWTGSLQIVPTPDEAPVELAENDLMLRFTAERSGLVQFTDGDSSATGSAVALDYGFTKGNLIFSGPGGNVTLRMPGSGELEASRMITSLLAGTVTIPGPGVMRVEQSEEAESEQRIRWTEQAEFTFAMLDGRLSSDLTRATFAGGVQANDGDARLSGDYVDAAFVASARGLRRLAQLDVDGAKADDGRGGTLIADAVRVDFADGTLGHDMDPTRIAASGHVRGGKDGSSIHAGSLIAGLQRDLDGDVSVSDVNANEGVEYKAEDGTFARADTIEADAIGESITLRGSPAYVGQNQTSVSGPEILVDGRNRRARVVGAGSFEHTGPDDAGHAMDVVATWTEGMSFDDYAGRVEAYGAATAVSRPNPLTRDTVSAERVLIEMTPWAGQPEGSETPNDRRELIRATAFGATNAEGQVKPASVESRVFAEDDPERVERLFYLEGMQIIADNEKQRLVVPEAGKLLILDRKRTGDDQKNASPDERGMLAELATSGPGLTRFEWRGGMTLDRETGAATMRRTVRVRHKSLLAGDFTDLQCEKLTAQIRETDENGKVAPTTTDAVKGELTLAEAAGAVYFKSGQRELIADRLLYDALAGRAIATAAPGNLVSMFDAERATPISSRAISWDLIRDRIEIERMSPVVTPGNLGSRP